MGSSKYTQEFRDEAVKQVTEKGYKVADVARRLGITPWSLYIWLKKAGWTSEGETKKSSSVTDAQEITRLKAQIKRLEEERDILKKAAAYFAKESR